MLSHYSLFFAISVIALSVTVSGAFADESTFAYHYTKGVVDKDSPFAGEVVWTLVDGDSGALVHSTNNGIVVIRFAVSQSENCIDSPAALCIDAKITSVKNTDTHNTGEEMGFIFDPQNNKETVSVVTGPLAGSDIAINSIYHRIPDSESIATKFTKSSPTFAFDGMPETLKVEKITTRESFPTQDVISVEYTSRHGGYGDRTDMMVTQVLTPHSLEVVVSNGVVKSAILDEEWDELRQRNIN